MKHTSSQGRESQSQSNSEKSEGKNKPLAQKSKKQNGSDGNSEESHEGHAEQRVKKDESGLKDSSNVYRSSSILKQAVRKGAMAMGLRKQSKQGTLGAKNKENGPKLIKSPLSNEAIEAEIQKIIKLNKEIDEKLAYFESPSYKKVDDDHMYKVEQEYLKVDVPTIIMSSLICGGMCSFKF